MALDKVARQFETTSPGKSVVGFPARLGAVMMSVGLLFLVHHTFAELVCPHYPAHSYKWRANTKRVCPVHKLDLVPLIPFYRCGSGNPGKRQGVGCRRGNGSELPSNKVPVACTQHQPQPAEMPSIAPSKEVAVTEDDGTALSFETYVETVVLTGTASNAKRVVLKWGPATEVLQNETELPDWKCTLKLTTPGTAYHLEVTATGEKPEPKTRRIYLKRHAQQLPRASGASYDEQDLRVYLVDGAEPSRKVELDKNDPKLLPDKEHRLRFEILDGRKNVALEATATVKVQKDGQVDQLLEPVTLLPFTRAVEVSVFQVRGGRPSPLPDKTDVELVPNEVNQPPLAVALNTIKLPPVAKITGSIGVAKFDQVPVGEYRVKVRGKIRDQIVAVTSESREKLLAQIKVPPITLRFKALRDGNTELPVRDVRFNFMDGNAEKTLETNALGIAEAEVSTAGEYKVALHSSPEGAWKAPPIAVTAAEEPQLMTVRLERVTVPVKFNFPSAEKQPDESSLPGVMLKPKEPWPGATVRLIGSESGPDKMEALEVGNYEVVLQAKEPDLWALTSGPRPLGALDSNRLRTSILVTSTGEAEYTVVRAKGDLTIEVELPMNPLLPPRADMIKIELKSDASQSVPELHWQKDVTGTRFTTNRPVRLARGSYGLTLKDPPPHCQWSEANPNKTVAVPVDSRVVFRLTQRTGSVSLTGLFPDLEGKSEVQYLFETQCLIPSCPYHQKSFELAAIVSPDSDGTARIVEGAGQAMGRPAVLASGTYKLTARFPANSRYEFLKGRLGDILLQVPAGDARPTEVKLRPPLPNNSDDWFKEVSVTLSGLDKKTWERRKGDVEVKLFVPGFFLLGYLQPALRHEGSGWKPADLDSIIKMAADKKNGWVGIKTWKNPKLSEKPNNQGVAFDLQLPSPLPKAPFLYKIVVTFAVPGAVDVSNSRANERSNSAKIYSGRIDDTGCAIVSP